MALNRSIDYLKNKRIENQQLRRVAFLVNFLACRSSDNLTLLVLLRLEDEVRLRVQYVPTKSSSVMEQALKIFMLRTY